LIIKIYQIKGIKTCLDQSFVVIDVELLLSHMVLKMCRLICGRLFMEI